MKKLLALLFSFALLASVGVAFASDENEDNEDEAKTEESESQEEAREQKKEELEEKREAFKQEREKNREEFKNQRELNKQNFEQARELWKQQREDALEKFKQEKEALKVKFKEKFTEERCARISERIKNRTEHFDEREGKHSKVYTNLINRINKFIARAEAKNIDTTTIKNHLAELETKIDRFKADFAAYRAKLAESKSFTCGRSEGEFRGTLLEAKALLKTVHADAAEIRKYVRETILPDLKALKAQMPKDAEKAEDDDNEADND